MQPYISPAQYGAATETDGERPDLRFLALSGVLLLLGCVALFLLLQSPAIWVSTTGLSERWPALYDPLRQFVVGLIELVNGGGDFGVLNSRIYYGIMAWLFGVYIIALVRTYRAGLFPEKQGVALLKVILLITALIFALFLFVPGSFTSDLFAYSWYGRVFAIYGGNPYVDLPSQYIPLESPSWQQHVSWEGEPNVYGPLWTLLAGGIAIFGQAGDDQIVNHVLGHKLLVFAAHLVNTWLVWRLSGMIIKRYRSLEAITTESPGPGEGQAPIASVPKSWLPAAQVAAAIAYAWNPLLLVETGVGGHNDELVLTTLFAGIWLHLVGRWRLAALALSLGLLIKVMPAVIFVGGYIAFLFWQGTGHEPWQRLANGLARAAQAAIIVALVWLAAWTPFLPPLKTVEVFANSPASRYYLHSLGTVIRYTVPDEIGALAARQGWQLDGQWTPEAMGARLDGSTRGGLAGLSLVISLLILWRARTFPRLITAVGWIVFTCLVIGSVWFWPWYAVWIVGPMALAPPGRFYKAALLLCMSSLVVYGVNPSLSADAFGRLWAWTGLFITAPPLLYLLGSWLIERKSARAPFSLRPLWSKS